MQGDAESTETCWRAERKTKRRAEERQKKRLKLYNNAETNYGSSRREIHS